MTERTSRRIASIAARGVRNPFDLSGDEIKAVCASALTQAPDRKPILSRIKGMIMGEAS